MAEEKYDIEGWGKPEDRPKQPADLHKTIMDIQKSLETIPQHTSEIPPLKKNDRPVEKTRYEMVDGKWVAIGREIVPEEKSEQRHKIQAPKNSAEDRRVRKQPIERINPNE